MRRLKTSIRAATFVLVATFPCQSEAASLAQAARLEEARRAALARQRLNVPSYTDEDLGRVRVLGHLASYAAPERPAARAGASRWVDAPRKVPPVVRLSALERAAARERLRRAALRAAYVAPAQPVRLASARALPKALGSGLVLPDAEPAAADARVLAAASVRPASPGEREPGPSPYPSYGDDDLRRAGQGRGNLNLLGSPATSHSVLLALESMEGPGAPGSTPPPGEATAAAADEAEWRSRARARQAALSEAREAARRLEEEVASLRVLADENGLQPAEYAERGRVLSDRVVALAQARRAVAAAERSKRELEQSARRSRIPPTWLLES